MGRIINTLRDPHGMGFSTCRPKQIMIKPGLTVLVGCNGAGKTTLIHGIKTELEKWQIPYYLYDNLKNGGDYAAETAFFANDISSFMAMKCLSEGENICGNVGEVVSKFKEFLETGKIDGRTSACRRMYKCQDVSDTKERWLLFDAIGSGCSIDNVIDMKFVFNDMVKRAKEQGYELYVVVSANEYEFANGADCMDVTNGKYVTFSDYDDFKKFIMQSRKKKEERMERRRKGKDA